MFAGALSVALPAIIALLMANLVMGVMTRSAPQMNIFSIGFPMTMMAGFTILIFTLPNMLSVFERLMDESFLVMLEVLK
jgi:flagellar biosynthetic protein FliR